MFRRFRQSRRPKDNRRYVIKTLGHVCSQGTQGRLCAGSKSPTLVNRVSSGRYSARHKAFEAEEQNPPQEPEYATVKKYNDEEDQDSPVEAQVAEADEDEAAKKKRKEAEIEAEKRRKDAEVKKLVKGAASLKGYTKEEIAAMKHNIKFNDRFTGLQDSSGGYELEETGSSQVRMTLRHTGSKFDGDTRS